MGDTFLLHHLAESSAEGFPAKAAVTSGADTPPYGELHRRVTGFAAGLMAVCVSRGERVGISPDWRFETVVALTPAAVPQG